MAVRLNFSIRPLFRAWLVSRYACKSSLSRSNPGAMPSSHQHIDGFGALERGERGAAGRRSLSKQSWIVCAPAPVARLFHRFLGSDHVPRNGKALSAKLSGIFLLERGTMRLSE